MIINYQLTPKNNPSRLVAKIANKLGFRTITTLSKQAINNENIFIWQYNEKLTQPERKLIENYCHVPKHRLVLWINNFTEF
ncbi:hypothetical protein [Limosilactobacillus walteri]|uniref:Uncharacterized protein n=1 Tax=Limosilactobacillus walteri TaxID=2268022 RepID=A0ABR8P8V0_9LACO|nr:hypothetical protein [Limosilactobacillus walteri]MBD5807143.1 hypothetical protein [Limosilactobacillus walteri]